MERGARTKSHLQRKTRSLPALQNRGTKQYIIWRDLVPRTRTCPPVCKQPASQRGAAPSPPATDNLELEKKRQRGRWGGAVYKAGPPHTHPKPRNAFPAMELNREAPVASSIPAGV